MNGNYILSIFGTILLASIVKSITGFGSALVVSPLLSMVLGPRTTIPLLVLYETGFGLVLLVQVRRSVVVREMVPMGLAAVVGIPIGTYVLASVNPQILKGVIGIVTVGAAALMFFGVTRPLKNPLRASAAAGFLSGVLGGCTGVTGPPVILFLHNQGAPKERFRANLIAYFVFLHVVEIPIFLYAGLLTMDVVRLFPPVVPGALLGLWVAQRLLPRINERMFRKATVVLLAALGMFTTMTVVW